MSAIKHLRLHSTAASLTHALIVCIVIFVTLKVKMGENTIFVSVVRP